MIRPPIKQCDGPIVLCAGVQFIFNLDKIPSQFILDESIFLWGEEASLSWRLLAFNQKIHYISDLLVEHVKSVSVMSLGFSYVLFQRNSFLKVLPYLLSIVR